MYRCIRKGLLNLKYKSYFKEKVYRLLSLLRLYLFIYDEKLVVLLNNYYS